MAMFLEIPVAKVVKATSMKDEQTGETSTYLATFMDEDSGGVLEVWSRDARLLNMAPRGGVPQFFHLQMAINPAVKTHEGTKLKKVSIELLEIIKASPKKRTFTDEVTK